MTELQERVRSEEDGRPGVDEWALVQAAIVDPAAFDPLYRRYVDPIYRFCYRRMGTREEAEDATSVTFAKAIGSLRSYRGGSLRAWLFAIADRVTLDQLRRRRREEPIDQAELVPDTGETPEEYALNAEARHQLRAALAGLTIDQRRVVELRLSGLDGNEIAEVMGRNRNAIDALQHRALERMRRSLARDEEHANG